MISRKKAPAPSDLLHTVPVNLGKVFMPPGGNHRCNKIYSVPAVSGLEIALGWFGLPDGSSCTKTMH